MLRKVLSCFLFLIIGSLPAQTYAKNFWLEVTSDVRGVDEILGTYIDTNTGQSGSSNGDDLTSDTTDARQKKSTIRPPIRFGYNHQHIRSKTLTFSSSLVLSNVYGRYDYPEGAIFGGIDFSDPLSFKLSSWDFALEHLVEFEPHEGWSIGVLVGFKRQFIKLDTTFGTWDLKDKFIANRVEGSVWVDRRILSLDRTVVRFQGTKGKGDMRFNLSLRQYF